MSKQSADCIASKLNQCCLNAILAGDQWWPHTSGGRLRFAHAISHLLRHRLGHFVKSNK